MQDLLWMWTPIWTESRVQGVLGSVGSAIAGGEAPVPRALKSLKPRQRTRWVILISEQPIAPGADKGVDRL